MSKRGKSRGSNQNSGFNKFMNNFKDFGGKRGSPLNELKKSIFFSWFTPAKCIVCGAMVCTLLLLGVGLTGVVIMALLLIILLLLCQL